MVPLVKVGLPDKTHLLPALEKVLYSGQVGEGEHVYSFESNFSRRFGVENTVAMSSGTAALHAALILSGVTAGDEVITTSMTAEPTNTTIFQMGAKIVWADVDPDTGNIDSESIQANLSPRTKAIVVVHYAGYPVNLNKIRKIADAHGVPLIEDCAHALGATYDGKGIGTFGDYSIFSFQAIKHMTTIDGGMLCLKNKSSLVEAKKIRWFGMLKGIPRTEVNIERQGFKYNMNNVTAVIGNCQLEYGIDNYLQSYIENGKFFDSQITNISGIDFVRCDELGTSSYWLYTLLCDDSNEIERKFTDAGISASKLHRPNHLHSIFKESLCDLPGLETFYRRMLHIPCGWWLESETRYKMIQLLKEG